MQNPIIEYFANRQISLDKNQLQLADELNLFFNGFKKRLKPSLKKPIKGFYIWGDVGRGKTMLMDSCFKLTNLPALRIHYHQFFKDLFIFLKDFNQQQLGIITYARQIAKKYQLICLDEFHLHDLTNALLMETFLRALLEKKVKIILTSNYPPGYLLADHHLHDRILPLINFIEKNCSIFKLDGED